MTGVYIFLALFIIVLLAMLCFSKNKGYPEESISSKEYIFKYYITLNSRKTSYDFPLIFLDDWKTEDLEEERVYILSLVLESKVDIRDYLLEEVWKDYKGKIVDIEVFEKVGDSGDGSYTTHVMIGTYKIVNFWE